jgi:hypothetical protein
MSIFKQYFLFLLNPKRNYLIVRQHNPVKVFFVVLFLAYLQIYLLHFIEPPISADEKQPPIPNHFLLLIFIPLWEELLFRLPLKISTINIIVAISLGISSITVLTVAKDIDSLTYYVGVFVLAIPICVSLKLLKTNRIEKILLSNYNLFFFSNIVIFASLHFHYVNLSLYAVLLYLVYGYSLSFLRISTNFLCAALLHAIFLARFYISFIQSI